MAEPNIEDLAAEVKALRKDLNRVIRGIQALEGQGGVITPKNLRKHLQSLGLRQPAAQRVKG